MQFLPSTLEGFTKKKRNAYHVCARSAHRKEKYTRNARCNTSSTVLCTGEQPSANLPKSLVSLIVRVRARFSRMEFSERLPSPLRAKRETKLLTSIMGKVDW